MHIKSTYNKYSITHLVPIVRALFSLLRKRCVKCLSNTYLAAHVNAPLSVLQKCLKSMNKQYPQLRSSVGRQTHKTNEQYI